MLMLILPISIPRSWQSCGDGRSQHSDATFLFPDFRPSKAKGCMAGATPSTTDHYPATHLPPFRLGASTACTWPLILFSPPAMLQFQNFGTRSSCVDNMTWGGWWVGGWWVGGWWIVHADKRHTMWHALLQEPSSGNSLHLSIDMPAT